MFVLSSCNKAEDITVTPDTPDVTPDTEYEEDEYVPFIFNYRADIQLTAKEQAVHDMTADFAFDYLKTSSAYSDGNTLVSPFSAMALLAMTSNGAEGKTKEEILNVIGTSGCSVSDVNEYYQSVYKQLQEVDKNVKFKSANSIWIQEGFPIRDSFREILNGSYDAEAANVDFSKPSATDIINARIKDKTRGMIPSFFKPGVLNASVVTANAVYFKAWWRRNFKDDTKRKEFTNADKTSSDVDMMRDYFPHGYTDTGKAQVLRKEYGNEAYSMYFILPSEADGLADIINTLDADSWNQIKSSMKQEYVHIELPRFEIGDDRSIKDILMDMGIRTAFTPSADFSSMSAVPLFIGKVQQNTKIKLDTKGTVAVSATVDEIWNTSNGNTTTPVYIPFIVDHPFAFIIEEVSTGVILFMGIVNRL